MPLLELKNIKKSFDQNVILKDLSLTVEKGEVIVILGPSGCGKSTLLRCINGLETIQGGEILLDGEVISNRKKDMHLIRQKIGMVFQSYDLFPHLTVMKNLLLGPKHAHEMNFNMDEVQKEAVAWLDRVGLADKKNAYPRQLSGGQKQRVAIVRMLCMHPEVMLFDEVTAALDPEMVREVLDVMMDLANDKKTMLIVTHQMQFARAVADKIVFMDAGEIVEISTPEEFWTNPKTERAKKFLSNFEFESRKKN
ncbi:amino acid ABC transporter ATP-binding protein, PAAT family (TC 3.A.1.3.-) [Treponema bryantii]|uniref:Amino acid ABC transporter ATP-binding protein, PAAT family (TC 3.A.1.3.-) n=1 Tax=Treponema bryantii TaxID=163 RepID=A0A1I3NB71_9SPIR|nr:amino acid ABC transporter ATP-binding protein [Treponema bryantii]SFJ06397.1 amino acid ABC transporter ATP-binding protein, PAAT family (TC 3.A.1.3.-) [Treponema bryantii]